MSYQALARKWRPQSFDEVIGQEHVVSALANALDSQRVHHAYLFTGTRGVGKTTLARIFARALNCETGVSASPCGDCAACHGVTQGNFIDLIEVDAASRTRVDDTRELLDNVQYAPTQGRFKIYLIDEVHMLSTHSFNALLKTLEEPPAHVKFLLATTDPQKLPATILSRCIQFNLKAMDVERLFGQLEKILQAEQLEFEPEALKVLSRSADGSVRDALSLLDQAIAFGNGRVETAQVRSMLGMIDNDFTSRLLVDVCANQPGRVLQTVASLAERSIDYTAAMDDLLTTLHHIALYQVAPEAVSAKGVEVESVQQLSDRCDAELTQLLYQIALIGKRDMAMAPDPRTGFEMALLRMTSFQPQAQNAATPSGTVQQSRPHPPAEPKPAAGRGSRIQRDPAVTRGGARPTVQADSGTDHPTPAEPAAPAIARRAFVERPPAAMPDPEPASPPGSFTPVTSASPSETVIDDSPAVRPASVAEVDLPMDNPPPVGELPPEMAEQAAVKRSARDWSALNTQAGWADYAESGGLGGIARELALNMVPKEQADGVLTMLLDEQARHLFKEARLNKINQHIQSISATAAPTLVVSIEAIAAGSVETPSQQKQRIVIESQQAAERSFREDPNVQELVNLFDAEIIDDSVRPAAD